MMRFVYDGTYEGLLTVMYELFHNRLTPGSIAASDRFQAGLFTDYLQIESDQALADKVAQGIEEKISAEALKHVFYAYLSEIEGIELAVYHYLKLGFRYGAAVDRHLTDEWVRKIHHARQRVAKEAHLLLGILRFRLLEGNVYYASMEPDHNVLCLIAPHFVARLADQNWMVHDVKREIAAVYDQHEWLVTKVTKPAQLHLAEEEVHYQELWKKFFQTIAIEERQNLDLQRRLVPARYWKHMVEKLGL